MSEVIDPFIRGFGDTPVKLPLAELPWLADRRTLAKDAYCLMGLPTVKQEAWKYTNLKDLRKLDLRLASGADVALPERLPATVPDIDAYRIVLVNGRFSPELSDVAGLPDRVKLNGLAQAIEDAPDAFVDRIGSLLSDIDEAVLALNTAYLADGFFLEIGRGVSLDKPVHLVSLAVGGDEPLAFHPRNLIIAGEGSAATVLETHASADENVDGTTLSNSVTEILVEQGANLGHYKLQQEAESGYHLATVAVKLEDKAVYDNFVLQLGGGLARSDIRCLVDGSHAEARINGAYHGGEGQHLDNTTFIDHAKPDSQSREVYKGVLEGNGRGVFQGKILVRQNAQRTDGHQLNRALLLSPKAEIDSKPELEIYADDVKCSHGATTGDLNEDQLFYLQARGVEEETARKILVQAFMFDVLEEIQNLQVRDIFHTAIAAKLGDIA